MIKEKEILERGSAFILIKTRFNNRRIQIRAEQGANDSTHEWQIDVFLLENISLPLKVLYSTIRRFGENVSIDDIYRAVKGRIKL